MSLPERVIDFVPDREARIAQANEAFRIPRQLYNAGIDPALSDKLAANYADGAAIVRDAFIPAWNGLIATLRQRAPSFWIVNQQPVYDAQTGRKQIRSYRSAELLWGFSSIDLVQDSVVESRHFVGLHALPDRHAHSFDAVSNLSDRRKHQALLKLGAFREWFCSHANIIESDVRQTPITGDTAPDKQINFFNIPSFSSKFLNPANITADLDTITTDGKEHDATEVLDEQLDFVRRTHTDFLYGQAKEMISAIQQIGQSIDIAVPDDGTVHFLNFKREWLESHIRAIS